MRPSDPPPRGLGWTIAPFGRVLSFILAVVALMVSMYVGWRYIGLVDCLSDRDLADQRRTAAIARATDAERRADLDLIRGGSLAPAERERLRALAVAARENTDRVRAEHPAPVVQSCK